MSEADISLLRQALDLPEAQRGDFISRACADDPVQRERLLRLLALDAESDALLDGGVEPVLAQAFVPDPAPPLLDRSGERVGPWRILRHLAEGGMGSVWLAERDDGQFRQTVALKTVKPGMDSAAVLRAFQREREVLARLQHPQIAHLIDGGVDDQVRPWFAMRHVEGEPLDRWLRRAPPLRQRLRLLASLCRVVAYAHRQLVVHQDIKPGNVLVQADGTPCLLDFGIGRILLGDVGEGTRTVQRFASPAYAAPEQIAGGAISTATDVYALGAILFELLTGRRYSAVHPGGDDTLRPSRAAAVGESEPFALPAAQLRGDLDAIAARALAADPARRYGSADLMADDIDRHLAGWPVSARPDGELYRLGKWLGRNRALAAALLLAVAALAAGLGLSLWQTHLARQQAQRATAMRDYLVGLFDAGRTNAEGVGVLDRRVVDLLDASADGLAHDLATLPAVRDEIYATLVEIYDANDRPERSLALARERVAQAERAFGVNDARVAPALVLLAGVLINHGDHAPVAALLDRAQALLDAAGEHASLTQAQLWQYRGTLADREGRSADALALLNRAVALLRERYPDSDDRITAQFALFQALPLDHDPVQSRALIEDMRAAVRAKYGDDHYYGVQADIAEAHLQVRQGEFEAGLAGLRRAVPRLQHFVGTWHRDVLVLRYQELDALLASGRTDEAWARLRRFDAQRAEHAPDQDLAEAYRAMGEEIEARRRGPGANAAAAQ